MRYTRYDFKRNKSKNNKKGLLAIFGAMIVFAAITGTFIFNISMKNPGAPQSTTAVKSQGTSAKFIAIQGGMFAKQENADKEKTALSPYGSAFIVKQGELNRVFSGIYLEDNYKAIVDSMNKNSKSNSKMVFTLNKKDICDAEIAEIVTANLKILNKLSENGVKAIQTKDFKTWTSTLKKPDNTSKNIEVLNQLKDYVGKMPEEVTRDKAPDNYIFLYGILKNICDISK